MLRISLNFYTFVLPDDGIGLPKMRVETQLRRNALNTKLREGCNYSLPFALNKRIMTDIATQKKELMKGLCDYFALLKSTKVYEGMDDAMHSNLDVAFTTLSRSINSVTTHNCNARFREKKSNVALSNHAT